MAVSQPMKPFYQDAAITIINDDFGAVTCIPPESVDLIVTSPPYNLQISYSGYGDGLPYQQYLDACRSWFRKCHSLAKGDGRFCLNIPLDKSKGGTAPVGADLTIAAREAGWQYKATVIWNEGNISRRTAWGSWLSASAPHIIAPVELIVIFFKGTWKKTSGSGISDIKRDEFIDWTNGIWTFAGEKKKRIGHPAPFPIELPLRCIKLLSYVGDVVLDPFAGSGTTLAVCRKAGRQGIGIEISPEYCALARDRIVQERAAEPLLQA